MSESQNPEKHAVLSKPEFSIEDASGIARASFGYEGQVDSLPGESDQNFRIRMPDDSSYVLKISNPQTPLALLELQNQALRLVYASDSVVGPQIIRSLENESVVTVGNAEQQWYVRLIQYIEGTPYAAVDSPATELRCEIGRSLASLDNTLSVLKHNRAAKRYLNWDLANAPEVVRERIQYLESSSQAAMIQQVLDQYRGISDRLEQLPKSVIHNDANDHNIIVASHVDPYRIAFIDYGDIVHSTTVNNLAICLAYLLMGADEPLEEVRPTLAGYNEINPLSHLEWSVVFPLVCLRLAQSVSICAEQKRLQPDNPYLTISEQPAWDGLAKLLAVSPEDVLIKWMTIDRPPMGSHSWEESLASELPPNGTTMAPEGGEELDFATNAESGPTSESDAIEEASLAQKILQRREQLISPSLSLSYDRPLHIVRGRGQYLFDESDRMYLDCVNNVCHVGHCHPQVVEAGIDQMRTLNTNTRYLHRNLTNYATRLTSTLPEPLTVCFFVNSGSEANDLAIRLARNYTQRFDLMTLDHAYHGHVSSLIDISPYKFNSHGGKGQPSFVHVAPIPDAYRRSLEGTPDEVAKQFAEEAVEVMNDANEGLAAFFAEPIMGCGGQVPLPVGYLKRVYDAVHAQGGLCVADEVQVGFGRVGTHFWGFEQHDVVPDIVTMGKPIGNGHPLAAVVTTREIADAFNNGMEYFNTFGGNPVSCAIGSAVLDAIDEQGLQQHANEMGHFLLNEWLRLKEKFPVIGDVRGSGLFLGMELVKDRATKEPAAETAHQLVQQMRADHVLLSTDGPLHNVIKFKPPMVFDVANAERVTALLERHLSRMEVE